MPKPEYTESCSDCIHYTETSYMFGQCEACQHEVSCNAICTMFAERQISPEMRRYAETVPVVTEQAEPEHNAMYWMNKALETAHEAWKNLYDTVDFKKAIEEAEAIKQRLGIVESKNMTNGDRVREALSKLSDYKIAHLIDFCGIFDECDECPMNGMPKCGSSNPDSRRAWLKLEVTDNDEC